MKFLTELVALLLTLGGLDNYFALSAIKISWSSQCQKRNLITSVHTQH